jgi:pimeloyl-ACP methyl ester carboxylesterase
METLLLLHGAIGAADQLKPLAVALSADYNVHMLDFSGHGNAPAAAGPFSIELFANDVLQYMCANSLERVSIFGYSMGGYVGLYLAKNHPERVNSVITLATKFHWDSEIAAREILMLNPEKIEQKLPAFAATLRDRHSGMDWKEVLKMTVEMMVALGADNTLKPADYAGITAPSLLLLGDRDKMVSLDETVATYKCLPVAQLGVLPGTSHPIEQVNVDMLVFTIKQFLQA